jgi:6,7-dimethyl-8-ribityllumazine synthase
MPPESRQLPAIAPGPADGRIAFVQSCWHREIVDAGRDGFIDEMTRLGYRADSIDCFEVPGAFEIPLRAKLLALAGRHEAIVAGGFVVDGGIYRHDFVASAVIDGLMRVQLDTCVPVFSMVLTPHRFHEHDSHRDYFHAHLRGKGREAAAAVHATLAGHRALARPDRSDAAFAA